ncbi:hypothetical protein OPQ81_007361 [Rhizoctonia solani]|nr:hypothetical protein OPQ81_007361 [Rhizoctonia solani]
MRVSNLVLFALSSVSLAFAQNGASDALALVTTFNNQFQSSQPSETAPQLVSLTTQLQSLGKSLPTDPSTKSQIAVQAAAIVSRVASQGMSVGPGALGGDIQSALKAFLEGVGGCVEGVDKEISRLLGVGVQVFLKNNVGSAMAVLSRADSQPLVANVQVGASVNAGSTEWSSLRHHTDLSLARFAVTYPPTSATPEIIAQLAIKTVSIIPLALAKDVTRDLKDSILNLEKCVPGVDKEIYRMRVRSIFVFKPKGSEGRGGRK